QRAPAGDRRQGRGSTRGARLTPELNGPPPTETMAKARRRRARLISTHPRGREGTEAPMGPEGGAVPERRSTDEAGGVRTASAPSLDGRRARVLSGSPPESPLARPPLDEALSADEGRLHAPAVPALGVPPPAADTPDEWPGRRHVLDLDDFSA